MSHHHPCLLQTSEEIFRHLQNIVDFGKNVMTEFFGENYVHHGVSHFCSCDLQCGVASSEQITWWTVLLLLWARCAPGLPLPGQASLKGTRGQCTHVPWDFPDPSIVFESAWMASTGQALADFWSRLLAQSWPDGAPEG